MIKNSKVTANINGIVKKKKQFGKSKAQFTIEVNNQFSGKKQYITGDMEFLNKTFVNFLIKGKELENIKNNKKVNLENKTHKSLVKNLNASSFNQSRGMQKFFFEIIN